MWEQVRDECLQCDFGLTWFKFPPAVLAKYELVEFVSLVDSIRKGDLRTFNDALVKYQHRFIR